MNSPMMVQIDVQSNAGEQLSSWIEASRKVKPHFWIYLKVDSTWKWYEIMKIYDVEVPKDQLGVRGFDNNNYEKHDGTAIKDRK